MGPRTSQAISRAVALAVMPNGCWHHSMDLKAFETSVVALAVMPNGCWHDQMTDTPTLNYCVALAVMPNGCWHDASEDGTGRGTPWRWR